MFEGSVNLSPHHIRCRTGGETQEELQMKKTNVFVYGTLLKGRSNHRLIADCELLGRGTVTGFEMYDLGYYPAIVPGEGSVLGEVYSVDNETLKKLDFFEGSGELYIRKTVRVSMEKDDADAEVYVYLTELERDRESRIWEYQQPYGSSDAEHVWYVSYGSNMCREPEGVNKALNPVTFLKEDPIVQQYPLCKTFVFLHRGHFTFCPFLPLRFTTDGELLLLQKFICAFAEYQPA